MKSQSLRSMASLLLAGIAVLATSLPARAAVDCTAPAGIEQQRACKAAAEGVQSLRRFSERTRMIYAIHMPHYARAIAAAATDPVRVSQRR